MMSPSSIIWMLLGSVVLSATAVADDRYSSELEAWRRNREASLKAEDGWLSVSGLFWLHEGSTPIGSDPSNDIVLPAHAPAEVGVITLKDGQAQFQAATGAKVTLAGKPFSNGVLRSDELGEPDVLKVGDLRLIVIKRGSRYAIRLKDNQSPLRTSFAGLRWHPPREDWRVSAKFVPYDSPVKLSMDTIVGETEVEESPGEVVFNHGGQEYRLQAAKLKDGGLWFVFRDLTSGRTTHGGARQLSTAAPIGDKVELDFNKAVNLPCAYIPFATCPLAPPRNRLKVAIEAGELKYEPRPVAPLMSR